MPFSSNKFDEKSSLAYLFEFSGFKSTNLPSIEIPLGCGGIEKLSTISPNFIIFYSQIDLIEILK